jgi:hypothetical protein
VIPGLDHGIDETTLRLALAFAAKCFQGRG